MQRSNFANSVLTLAALSLPFAVGCGGSSSTPATAQNGAAQNGAAQTPTTSVGVPTTLINDGARTAPAQPVAIFLDALRKGDERAANGVLTNLARQELPKTTWQIQPLGSPAGQYKIGRVSFPYADDTKVALVECTWTEPPVEGNTQEVMDIVCEVKQEAEGWRISGIAQNIPGTEQAMLLDFEDAVSLQATIDEATGQTSPTAQPPAGTQVATGQQAGQQAGLPAFPTGPALPTSGAAANQGQTLPSYPQIALPPLDNAPINR